MASTAASINVHEEFVMIWGNVCDMMLNKNVGYKIVVWYVLNNDQKA